MQKKSLRRFCGILTATAVVFGQSLSIMPANAADETEYVYGTMDIPYADYYYGELGYDVSTTNGTIDYTADIAGDAGLRADGVYDVVTSATTSKWKSQAGTYASEPDENGGGKILGVNEAYVAIPRDLYDTLSSSTEKDGVLMSLFSTFVEDSSLTSAPSSYKVLYADGTLSATVGESTTLSDVTCTVNPDSVWGDYQLSMNGLTINDTVYGVIVTDTNGTEYALMHLENIWKNGTELSWSAGFKTNEAKGNPLRSEPYKNTSGATLKTVTYLTSSGIQVVDLGDGIYLPKKHTGTITPEETPVTAGKATVTLENFPSDFELSLTADGLAGATYENGSLTYDASSAKAGSYALEAIDTSGIYTHSTANLVLTTDAIPVVYDAQSKKLVPAEGYTSEDVAAYVKNFNNVSVNDTDYIATGRGAFTFISEDGTIDFKAEKTSGRGPSATTTPVFPDEGIYTLKISATGYTNDYTFEVNVTKDESVLGDANADGSVTVDDASLVLNYYAKKAAGLEVEGLEEFKNITVGDVDKNGEISVDDASMILSYYAKEAAGLNPSWDDIVKN